MHQAVCGDAMTSRTGSTTQPSRQTPAEPPALTTDLAAAIRGIARRASAARRANAAGQIWIQSDASPDGWIRGRIVEHAPGYLGVLTHAAPQTGHGTWARFGDSPVEPDAEQVRVFPLASHPLGREGDKPTGPFLVECETPVDEAISTRVHA